MNIKDYEITLKPLQDDDVPLFIKWLNKDFIYKWFCPDGDEEKEAWIEEIRNRDNYKHYKHFIVYHNDTKIGYCIYFDIYYEPEYLHQYYRMTCEENSTFEIGFCIGEEDYLNKGIGKIIVQKLEKEIIKEGGKVLLADPSEENIISIKTLLSNGFVKYKDSDYRKRICENLCLMFNEKG